MSDSLAPARGLVFGVMFGLVAWLVIVGVFLAVLAHAGTSDDAARYELQGESKAPAHLILRGCHGWTEDTLATLHMKVFEPGALLVYRCVTP